LALVLVAGCDIPFPLVAPPAEAAVVVVDARIDAPFQPCPVTGGWTMLFGEGETRYLALATPNSWPIAEAVCEGQGPGIHLAAPDTQNELTQLEALVRMPPISGGLTWIGVARNADSNFEKAAFTKITFGVVDETFWAPMQPNNASGMEYGVSITGLSNLADENVASLRAAICECDHREIDMFAF